MPFLKSNFLSFSILFGFFLFLSVFFPFLCLASFIIISFYLSIIYSFYCFPDPLHLLFSKFLEVHVSCSFSSRSPFPFVPASVRPNFLISRSAKKIDKGALDRKAQHLRAQHCTAKHCNALLVECGLQCVGMQAALWYAETRSFC